jgi:hypothetical protein
MLYLYVYNSGITSSIIIIYKQIFLTKSASRKSCKHKNMTLLDVLRNIANNYLFTVISFPLPSFLTLTFRRALKEKEDIYITRP